MPAVDNSKAIEDLTKPSGGINHQIFLAASEIVNAAGKAGHKLRISWFNPASTPEHHVPGMAQSKGVAVDFMILGSRAAQDFIDSYAWANRNRLGICWIISRRRIRSNTWKGHVRSTDWQKYDGDNPHTDHTHMNFGMLVGTSGYGKVPQHNYVPLVPKKPIGHWHVKGVKDKANPQDEKYVNDGSFLWGWKNGKASVKFKPYQGMYGVSTFKDKKGNSWLVTDKGVSLRLAFLKKDG